jgi:hypothetical protein
MRIAGFFTRTLSAAYGDQDDDVEKIATGTNEGD